MIRESFMHRVVVALCAAGSLFLAGAAAAEPLKIRGSFVVPVANWQTILFEKPGLAKHLGSSYTFDIVRFQGTPEMVQALATGDLDIADISFTALAIAVLNAGMTDLRVIADEFQDGAPGYYSNETFVLKDSPIKTVADLKGRILASNISGGVVDITLRSMLRQHHIDDKRDVTMIEIPFRSMQGALFDRKVDTMSGAVPFSFDAKLRAGARVLFTQREALGRTQMIMWAARAGFIAKNRAALVDFLEDAIRAERWYLDPAHHQEVVDIAVRVGKQPADYWNAWLFRKNGQSGDYYRDPNAMPDLAALQKNIDTQHELGFIKSAFSVKDYADLSPVAEAAARLK
jgi:sulfonate transport system substrate-binding protein